MNGEDILEILVYTIDGDDNDQLMISLLPY
jgi:hypothetical protein